MLGRLERFVPLARLKDLEILGAAPRGVKPLGQEDWERIAGMLALA